MHVRIVTFRLDHLEPQAYRHHAEQIAGVFAEWPGLIAKVWLAEEPSGTYGGVYVFESRSAADRSRTTRAFEQMALNPWFTDLVVREFDVLDAPTAITAGVLASQRDDSATADRATSVAA